MLSAIEKILFLKTVAIFAGLPDDALAAAARYAAEIQAGPGDTIVTKGDPGDALYVVATGALTVHDGERALDRLGEGEVFGEMALLDAEPRSASVTAVEDSLLLRFEAEDFDDLIADYPAVAHAVIHVLSGRLRGRMADLERLRE